MDGAVDGRSGLGAGRGRSGCLRRFPASLGPHAATSRRPVGRVGSARHPGDGDGVAVHNRRAGRVRFAVSSRPRSTRREPARGTGRCGGDAHARPPSANFGKRPGSLPNASRLPGRRTPTVRRSRGSSRSRMVATRRTSRNSTSSRTARWCCWPCPSLRAELKAGRFGSTEQTYLALDSPRPALNSDVRASLPAELDSSVVIGPLGWACGSAHLRHRE